jgi:hypothetical protein
VLHFFERLERDVPLDADDVSTMDLIGRHDAAGLNVDRRGERAPRVRRR